MSDLPLVLIPARLNSTRLPRKALADINGLPMIARTALNVSRARGHAGVVVLTDSEEIKRVVEAVGISCLLSDKPCVSGTERVAQALSGSNLSTLKAYCPKWGGEWVINVQGDEPLLPRSSFISLASTLPAWFTQGVKLVTLGTPIAELSPEAKSHAVNRESVVKVAVNDHGRALFFSRHPIGGEAAWVHTGVYAYHLSALELLSLAPSALAQAERLEQLSWLEAGWEIGVVHAPPHPPGVDTLEELEFTREAFQSRDFE